MNSNGSFSGKLGNITGCRWKGVHYVRKLPQRTAPPSEKQLVNRFIFGLVHSWISPINDYVRLGFKDYGERVYGNNAAKSMIFDKALIRDGYNSKIDPSCVQVSYGSLELPNVQMELALGEKLIFTWNPAISSDGHPQDQIMPLAYNVHAKAASFYLYGEFRKNGREEINLAGVTPGTYHVYAAFVAYDRSRQSNSVYLGAVQI